MKFKKVDLPFENWELEPIIDSHTVELHHEKHHARYEKSFNSSIEGTPIMDYSSLDQVLLDIDKFDGELNDQIRRNGGGIWNHNFYWTQFIIGDRELNDEEQKILDLIVKQFGSKEAFIDEFISASLKLFGSGWIWLVNDGGELKIMTTPNQENPLMYGIRDVLIGIDLWEHAYYLKYLNSRKKYLVNVLKLTIVR